jgi:hypothetical protein
MTQTTVSHVAGRSGAPPHQGKMFGAFPSIVIRDIGSFAFLATRPSSSPIGGGYVYVSRVAPMDAQAVAADMTVPQKLLLGAIGAVQKTT